jgi:hypothetical protein
MEGYEKLAGMMGDKPTLGIFRRFASVGAQNLLYLQAELIYLEKRWQEWLWRDSQLWQTTPASELIPLQVRNAEDPLSSWMIERFITWYHHRFGHLHKSDPENQYTEYEDDKLLRIANILGTFIASLVPLLSIIVLYFIPNLLARLGLVVLFTAMFAFLLILMTKAKMVEIFTATSA